LEVRKMEHNTLPAPLSQISIQISD